MPQPVPAIPQIPAGYGPLPADLTLWVTDAFSFLATPPVFRAQLTTAAPLSGGFFNLLGFNSVLEDPYGGWSATSTGSQPADSWLCPVGCAGWYAVSMAAFADSQGSSASDQLVGALYLNGSLYQYASDDWAASGADTGSPGFAQIYLLPGDYVQAYVFVTAGVNTPATAGQYPSLELSWVSS